MNGISVHFWRGVWRENPALVHLLGLCPLLAVSNTVVTALGLGVATLVALIILNSLVSVTRHWVPHEVRLPVYVLFLASAVTVVDLGLEAYAFDLHATLGIFIPLIVTNCALLARAEVFASKQALLPSAWDAICTGLGFILVLVALGALRELLAFGSLLQGASMLFGAGAESWTLRLHSGGGLLLAALPPGAFLGLAGLAAARNAIWNETSPGAPGHERDTVER